MPRNEFYRELGNRIDRELHSDYQPYPCNFIALDELEGGNRFVDHYTQQDVEHFNNYLQGQLAKITIANKDNDFLRTAMLNMYANPLRNYLRVKDIER